MAEIPVERKTAPPFVWPLIIIGLLGVLGLIVYLRRQSGDVANNTPARTAPAAGQADNPQGPGQASLAAQPLTDVNAMTTAREPAALAGRRAQLSGVIVQRVLSDRVFVVGNGAGQEVLVVLDEKLDRGAAEQRVVVKAAQTVALDGVVERSPGAGATARGLNEADSAALRGQPIYLLAQSIKGTP